MGHPGYLACGIWVEVGDGGVEEAGDGHLVFADAVDDAAGEFVCAEVVEVSGVGDVAFDAGIAAGLELHECAVGAFFAHGFEHGLRHGVEIDDASVGVGGDLA